MRKCESDEGEGRFPIPSGNRFRSLALSHSRTHVHAAGWRLGPQVTVATFSSTGPRTASGSGA